MVTIDEFNALAILALVVAFLVGLLLWPVFDAVRRISNRTVLAFAYWRDRHLGYDWGRAWRKAGQ